MEYDHVLYRCPSKCYHSLHKPWLTILQAQLADTYIEQLKAINCSVQFGGWAIIYVPFCPLHHIFWASCSSSKHCKVYFFMTKGISYDTIRNSSMFHPGGLTSGFVCCHSQASPFIHHHAPQQVVFFYISCTPCWLPSSHLCYWHIWWCPWICDWCLNWSRQWMHPHCCGPQNQIPRHSLCHRTPAPHYPFSKKVYQDRISIQPPTTI